MTDRLLKKHGRRNASSASGGRFLFLVTLLPHAANAFSAGGRLILNVVDRDTGRPIACRMHLYQQNGRRFKPRRVPFHHDHFVFEGSIDLKLPKGQYSFELECAAPSISPARRPVHHHRFRGRREDRPT